MAGTADAAERTPVEHFTGRLPSASQNDSTTEIAQNTWAPGTAIDALYARNSSAGVDRGPIADITLPSGWTQGEQSYGAIGQSSNEVFSPAGDATTKLGIFYGGLPVGEDAARAFRDVLAQKPANDGAQPLSPDEIRSLSQVMGRYQAGDNQYTNSGQYRAPAFDMRNAITMQVNGRTVVAVEGSFRDARGNALRDFVGIFADSDGSGQRVEQVFMSTAPGQMANRSKDFIDTINSIVWKK
jgi:hypothetical protein